MNTWRQQCDDYLKGRTGTYDFRCRRYREVARKIDSLATLNAEPITIVDLGAGRCEFGAYLRHVYENREDGSANRLTYIPFDGSIDGINLEEQFPLVLGVSYFVAIEFLEHLSELSVKMYLEWMPKHCTVGVIVTTPNPHRVDVLSMDPTHKTPIRPSTFHDFGYEFDAKELFDTGVPDTIIAWRKSSRRYDTQHREERW